MIYSLYHAYTDTPMDDNGLPGWVDIIGCIVDMLIGIVMIAWIVDMLIGLLTLTAECAGQAASLGMIA